MAFTKKEFKPVPAGEYLVAARKMTEGPLKSGNGNGIEAEFEILEGEYAKNKVWHKFITTHSVAKAAEIGNDMLSRYLKAVGQDQGLDGIGNDYTQLENYLNKALTVRVTIEEGRERPDGGKYKDKNKVLGFATR